MFYSLYLEEDLENEVKRASKAVIRTVKFLAMSGACKAIFQPTQGLKERTFDSCEFSAEGTFPLRNIGGYEPYRVSEELTSREKTHSSVHVDKRSKQHHGCPNSGFTNRSSQRQSALPLFSKTKRPRALYTLPWYLDNPPACLRRRVCTQVLIG